MGLLTKLFIGITMLFTSVIGATVTDKVNTNFDIEKQTVETQNATIKRLNSQSNNNINTIEGSNVSYDLKILYGGDNPNQYDLNSLLPTSNTDKDTNFKFYCMKPVNNSLYLYLYHKEVSNLSIVSATFSISTAKTQKSDGTFADSYSNYSARFINSYGYQGRFMKFAIDSIVNSSDSFRFVIKDVFITYKTTGGANTSRGAFPINDEAFFKLGANDDYIYEYYKDDYVRVTESDVKLLLTKSVLATTAFGDDIYNTYNEDFYYFFSTDRSMEELIEIQYDYQYVTYEAKTSLVGKWVQVADLGTEAYTGLLNYTTGTSGRWNVRADNITINSNKLVQNQRIKQGTFTETVSRPYFLWWTQQVQYKMKNIINLGNMSDLETGVNGNDREQDYYKNLRDFCNAVQSDKVKSGGQKYQWAFRVKSDSRSVTNSWNEFEWWYWLSLGIGTDGVTNIAYTTAHEVKQAVVTWLHFRTGGQDFKLNALSIPADTTGVYADTVPFETLLDVVADKFNSSWDTLINAFKNLADNIVPILILVATILILIICWPIFSSVFSIVGTSLKYGVEKNKKKKLEKVKKENDSKHKKRE